MKKTVTIIVIICILAALVGIDYVHAHKSAQGESITFAETYEEESTAGQSTTDKAQKKAEKSTSKKSSDKTESTDKTDKDKTEKESSADKKEDKSTEPSKEDKSEKESKTKKESSTKKPASTTKKPDSATTEKSTHTTTDKVPDKTQCGLTIECITLLDKMDKLPEGHEKYVPKNGYILKNYSVKLKKGDTVYDILKRACSEKNIPINQRPAGSSVYIVGINNIDEGDCTKQSGWTYYVNGSFPLKPIDKYTLEGGEEIHFKYVTSYNDRL
ncbi:MAG: DUF4430 domain-containing protein [Eubacterium sp.]|nr:DUF4430 domain-containing protein [Eubacterium sp.]